MRAWRLIWRGEVLVSVVRHPVLLQEDTCTDTKDGAHVCRIHVEDHERLDEAVRKARAKHPEWEAVHEALPEGEGEDEEP